MTGKKEVPPFFNVRWTIVIDYVPREEVPEVNRAMRKLREERKIKKKIWW